MGIYIRSASSKRSRTGHYGELDDDIYDCEVVSSIICKLFDEWWSVLHLLWMHICGIVELLIESKL